MISSNTLPKWYTYLPSPKLHINWLSHFLFRAVLRDIWEAVSQATVLILPQIKLNSQLSCCACSSIDSTLYLPCGENKGIHICQNQNYILKMSVWLYIIYALIKMIKVLKLNHIYVCVIMCVHKCINDYLVGDCSLSIIGNKKTHRLWTCKIHCYS